jgi:hypothetical protein
MPQIGQRDALDVLTKPRLLEVADALGLSIPVRWPKSGIMDAIASSPRAPFGRILELLSCLLSTFSPATGSTQVGGSCGG